MNTPKKTLAERIRKNGGLLEESENYRRAACSSASWAAVDRERT